MTTATESTVESPPSTKLAVSRIWCGGLAAAGLLWMGQPPWALWPLAFLALMPLLWFIAQPLPLGRRGYTALWVSGCAYWLLSLQGLRLANPALIPGWIALCLYLAIYFPLFVGLTRVALRRTRLPLLLAGPLVWMGLELIRSYAFTGFSALMLGHAMLSAPVLFQSADLFGTYAVSGVVVLIATTALILGSHMVGRPLPLAHCWKRQSVYALVIIAIVCGYGVWRLHEAESFEDHPLTIALLQTDALSVYELNPERDAAMFQGYVQQSVTAARHATDQGETIDLLVWPESTFSAGRSRYSFAHPTEWDLPAEWTGDRTSFMDQIDWMQREFDGRARQLQQLVMQTTGKAVAPALLLGGSQVVVGKGMPLTYSTAMMYDAAGNLLDWYGKRHLVMFGEYIPLGDRFPWLYQMGPLSFGVTPGPKFVACSFNGVQVAPSICFETMVERVTNRQVRELARAGTPAEVLVNITNDGWFHGSSVLDHHLRCTQAAAVSHRVPIVVAANSGITAWIDSSGRLVRQLPRKTEGFLLAKPVLDPRVTLYQWIGDWPMFFPALLCVYLAWRGWRSSGTS